MNHLDLKNAIKAGFVWEIEVFNRREQRLVSIERIHNLCPIQGLNLMGSVMFLGTPAPAAWYVGIYEGNYTPLDTDTASTFPGAATECTAYDETTRRQFVPGSISSGALDNTASRAEFTMNASKTIYGGFIASASGKGSTSGSLISAVRFSSPKVLSDEALLRVRCGFTFASA